MKKILLSLAILLSAVSISSAQAPFQFGVKGGLDFAQLSSGSSLSSNSQAGYLAGLWLRLSIGPLNFQPEMYFNTKTLNTSSTHNDTTTQTKVKTNDLDVPLLVGVRIGGGPVGLRLYGGGVLSFSLSNNQSQSVNSVVNSVNGNTLNYKNESYAAVAGAGLDLGYLAIDARYQYGLSTLNYKVISNATSTHTNLYTVTLALRLVKIGGGGGDKK